MTTALTLDKVFNLGDADLCGLSLTAIAENWAFRGDNDDLMPAPCWTLGAYIAERVMPFYRDNQIDLPIVSEKIARFFEQFTNQKYKIDSQSPESIATALEIMDILC